MMIMGKERSFTDISENPYAKGFAWIVGGAFALITGTVAATKYFDTEYFTKQEVLQYAQANTKQLESINTNTEFLIDRKEKKDIDKELFKLEQIPASKLTPADRAVYEKLKRERSDLVNSWAQRGRALQ